MSITRPFRSIATLPIYLLVMEVAYDKAAEPTFLQFTLHTKYLRQSVLRELLWKVDILNTILRT